MSKIEWTEKTWNPTTGCTKISPGCDNCYAARMARRLAGRYGYPAPPDHFTLTIHENLLQRPFSWVKPRIVFVASMSDLFHPNVDTHLIGQILGVIKQLPRHTFQVLTKRSARMVEFFRRHPQYRDLPNMWLGVSVEHPDYLWRVRDLISCAAVVRFVSFEPLLAPINLSLSVNTDPDDLLIHHLQWVIVGGESGPGARPMHPDWPAHLRDQCKDAGIPFFFKQWGAWAPLWTLLNDGHTLSTAQLLTRQPVQPDTPAVKTAVMYRVGKKRAGRLLHHRQHDAMPLIFRSTGDTHGIAQPQTQ